MPPRHTRELSAKEKRAIRKLVTSTCATYDPEYECLLLEGTCYMFTIAFNTSGLCKYFRDAVLPTDPALEAVFTGKATKPCQRCGRNSPPPRSPCADEPSCPQEPVRACGHRDAQRRPTDSIPKPFITAARRAARGDANTSSSVIGRPSGPDRGTRQLGYSSTVPGWFCVR